MDIGTLHVECCRLRKQQCRLSPISLNAGCTLRVMEREIT